MITVSQPKIAIEPTSDERMRGAVAAGGGVVVDEPADADALIWADPRKARELKDLLTRSDPVWVQLPFAGIERFFEAGAIDDARAWTCAKGIYGPATAEHALAFLLAGARRIHEHSAATSWRDGTFGAPERRLKEATVLIVGTGGIGRSLVEMLEPLGARVLAINRSGRPLEGAERTGKTSDLLTFAEDADHLVGAAALTPETHHMIDEAVFAAMPEHAWLVNVARGGLVDTDALVAALGNRRIGGAALDVTDPEPLPDGHPLWDLPNVIITPHVANTWDMALPELLSLVERNVHAFAHDRPLEGVVQVGAGY